MKIAELRGKTDDQLNDMLVNLKKEALNLRFQQASGELENTARIYTVRKTIARIMTLKNANDDVAVTEKTATKKKAAAPKAESKKAPAKKPAAKKPAAKKEAGDKE